MKRMLLVFAVAAGTVLATGRGTLAAVGQMTPRDVGVTRKANLAFIPGCVRTLFLPTARQSEHSLGRQRHGYSHRFFSPTFRSRRWQNHVYSRGTSGPTNRHRLPFLRNLLYGWRGTRNNRKG
jgi:hypothetical protein